MRTVSMENIQRKIKQAWIWMLRNDMFIYLLFVAIATLFWWGRTMSSPREMTISIPVTYTDISKNIVFETALPTHLDITIRDNGKILRQITHTSPAISISMSDRFQSEEGLLQISSDILRPKLQDLLPGSTIIQQIRPESIQSSYIRQESKVVAIGLRADWQLANQHQLSHEPLLSPTHVTIFGTREAISVIDTIYTDSISILNLSDSIQQSISLVLPEGVRATPERTTLTLIAEQFTDKTFTIPITVRDMPEHETMHLFPREVSVTVRVGISNFSKIHPEDFQAVCSYPTHAEATLPIQIIHNNPYVTLLRTNIREIEYIIER